MTNGRARRDPIDGLSKKERDFCDAYIDCGNLTEAYRRSYDVRTVAPDHVRYLARDLFKKSHIRTTVNRLRQEDIAKRANSREITLETTVNDLTDAAEFAKACDSPNALVSAIMGRAKVLGHVIDKKDISINGTLRSMSDRELREFIEGLDFRQIEGTAVAIEGTASDEDGATDGDEDDA